MTNVKYVSGQPVATIFKDKVVQEERRTLVG